MTDVPAAQQSPGPADEEAAHRFAWLQGPLELRAATLALLVPRGSRRGARAWQAETQDTPQAQALFDVAAKLSGAARLPWFEALLMRVAIQPVAVRNELLQATRRVMAARGVARPIDRLHWLTMRRSLGDVGSLAARPEASVEVAEWLESDVQAVASYSAFLARMVPGADADDPANKGWYDQVMVTWQPYADVPEWQPPDAEGMIDALGRLQTLSWMQRPVVIRNWVTTALKISPQTQLTDLSADALRLSCGLLDSPQPQDLASHYVSLADMESKS